MTTHTLSHETREALDNLKAYLSAGNEAVQYEFSYLADLVTHTPSVILGGIQAGGLPPDDVATDPAGEAFSVGRGAAGPFPASISLNTCCLVNPGAPIFGRRRQSRIDFLLANHGVTRLSKTAVREAQFVHGCDEAPTAGETGNDRTVASERSLRPLMGAEPSP